jgi:type II secretory pathway pseudopilin PulG
MGKTTRAGEPAQRGFTLAGLLIILTIVMVFVAYTVPKQWSVVMQRERELQTIFVMRQYARACYEFNQRHKVWPSSFDQLKDARLPRFLRGPKDGLVDPLTGEVDWLIIPFSAAQQGQVGGSQTNMSGTGQTSGGASFGFGGAAPGGGATGGTGGTGATGATGATGGTGQQSLPGIPMKDYAGGPFVGVRPPKTGESFLEYRGVKSYEQWSYTALDLTQEIVQFRQGIQMSLQWK